jgi:hypothetical protein
MTGDRGDLRRFSDFVGGDAGIPNIADLDRDLLHGYQRHLARVRADPKAARRLCESADSPAGRNGGGRGRATGSGPAGACSSHSTGASAWLRPTFGTHGSRNGVGRGAQADAFLHN